MNPKKVMIIEDDQMLSEFYAAFFKREFKLESDIFTNSLDVQNVLDEHGVNHWLFYVCDLNIPDKNDGRSGCLDTFQGFELIENFLPSCRVIIASGYISPEIAREARRLGVVSIFQKPPNLNSLAVLVNFLLTCVDI